MHITAWLRRLRRRRFVRELSCGVVAQLIGLAVFALTCSLVWLAFQALLVALLANASRASILNLVVTPVTIVGLLIDAARSSRDDFSNLIVWFLREFFHCGPRAMHEGYACVRRAWRWINLDVETCCLVLSYLAARKAPFPKAELMRDFSDLDWPGLLAQLRLIEGVLFIHDGLRLALSEPLRCRLHGMVLLPLRRELNSTTEPEPLTALQPEALTPHELLGLLPTATLHEVKAAYRARIKECHPDRFANMDRSTQELAERWAKALNAAYHAILAGNSNREAV